MKKCSTCLTTQRRWFEVLSKDCHDCRRQWKAYYSGRTQISPMERAILAEQISRVQEAR